MQLSVFSTDSQKSGFRLQYMEVFNWGTFDGQIYAIRPLGETSLLTGANASGKTTFVDALLTLIVPEKKYRFYNQSSGSEKKGDRTEESYVMGGYGFVNSEATGATKTLYLRENKEEAYSILLAGFTNEAGNAVTLFQVRYFNGSEMKRFYGVAHKEMQIESDFKPFDLGGGWKKRIDQQYNKGTRKQVEWFDTASKYALRLVDALGMQSIQALHLFNQTVGIKVLGNLDDFIRTHMLEPHNIEEDFQDLKKHLTTLLDAQRNIEKVEEQIRLLQPVQQHYEQFVRLQEQWKQAEFHLQTARIWNSYTKNHLLQQALEAARLAEKDIIQKLGKNKRLVDELIESERVVRNQIEQNKAGQRQIELEKQIGELREAIQEAETNLSMVKDWCSTLQIEDTMTDESGYNRLLKELGRAGHRLETEQRLNEEEEFPAKTTKVNAEEEKKQTEEELNILLQSKNNIPVSHIQLRKDLCLALKVDIAELPYAGELMQVKPDQFQWQPALEKLLHAFSMRLLVPDKHYKKVTRYVNSTNLGKRLVYYHVADPGVLAHPDEGTVYDKLEFHPDHKLSRWVEQQIIRQFNYSCLDDEKALERFEKAITLVGLIKSRDRHEKDDRPEKNDPRFYVMGWNNERKKEALIQRRNYLSDEIVKSTEILERCRRKAERVQKKLYAWSRLKEHQGFDTIDVNGLQRRVHKAEEQLQALRKDKELDALDNQLQDIRKQRVQADSEREWLLREQTMLETGITNHQQQQAALQGLLAHLTESDKDDLLAFQQQFSTALADVTLDSLETQYRTFYDKTQAHAVKLQNDIQKEHHQLERGIMRIKNPPAELLQRFPDWNGDVQSLTEEVEHAEEYLEWLEKLATENLPQYRKDFENYINVTITYKIGGLNEELEKWESQIKKDIQKLNRSLGGINFNRLPDTFIELGLRPVQNDTAIREFRGRLLDALPQATNWQQSSFEEKALHFRQKVQPLINTLDESETYRLRVMDVRNWFEFWADEKYQTNRELKKTYRQMGQLSGGEKAQLTYTILCSAIAYQFGITREGKNSKSLRFIAVDESFSNQDEEKATYLMELCKQLHLQLLVVTPSDKIQIVQDFIAHVHLAQRVNNRHSILYNMTIKELQQKMQKASLEA